MPPVNGAGIDFNFNGWGGKQSHARDAEVAEYVTDAAEVQRLSTRLVLEGGGIEVDGAGTAIITESCVLNANRNPGLRKEACEAELKRLLGLRKIIWLPGIAGRDITDGHTDFYARFAAPGVVVAGLDDDPDSYDNAVTRRPPRNPATGHRRTRAALARGSAQGARDGTQHLRDGRVRGRLYQLLRVQRRPSSARSSVTRAPMPTPRALMRDLFPKREVVQLDIDGIAAGGGGIHCTTQQQPR
jgi:agmatine deiminase